MNKNYNPINDIQRKRRFKYGTFALILTVTVIALVILINAIFGSLCLKNGWFIDMTERDLYTPDPNAMNLLEEYRGSEEFNVEFIFCMPEDKLIKNDLCNMVNSILKQYDEEYDFISVKYIDINQNPQLLDKYLNNTAASPKTTSVIVTNGTNSIVYSIDSFFVRSDESSTSYYAVNADQKIVSAILRLSGDKPIAHFVTNHGEAVENTVLRELFVDAGYEVIDIDLTTEELDPSAKMVVINNPKTDFWGADQVVNEIKKLDTLLDGSAGLMVFLDETANELPVLEDFLAHWGVRFERQSVRDYSSSAPGTDGKVIYAQYATTGNGATITKSLRESSSPQKPVVTNCRPITLLYDDTTGKYFSNNSGTRYASSILMTSTDAVSYPLDGEGKSTEGAVNVLTLTVQQRKKDGVDQQSFLIAGGTNAFSDNEYINGSSYANKDILYNALKTMAKKNVPSNVRVKVFSNDSLTLTAKEANTWTAICTLLFPSAIALVGIVVYARRRYL
ncbi:MAG: Gldg family protein [Clostridia bacterium]|nr:Gldg family protein [Clostridia bacterium]